MDYTIEILAALANRNRLKIVGLLLEFNEICVCHFKDLLKISGASVSKHLAVLQKANILKSRRQGKWIYYSLAEDFKREKYLIGWLESKLSQTEEHKKDIDFVKKALTNNKC